MKRAVLLLAACAEPAGTTVTVSGSAAPHVDVVFMGVHGIDCDAGITTPNLLEGETNKALRDAGRRLVVLADHTKWGVVGLCQFAALADAA